MADVCTGLVTEDSPGEKQFEEEQGQSQEQEQRVEDGQEQVEEGGEEGREVEDGRDIGRHWAETLHMVGVKLSSAQCSVMQQCSAV